MTAIETLRSKFISAYANVPQNLRKDIIAVIGNEMYSWQTALYEIKERTKLGDKILNTLNQIGLI